eukprot:1003241-Alexandrium_andersonii.AAC.1
MRGKYISMLVCAPNIDDYISGVILHPEHMTLVNEHGKKLYKCILDNGMIPGVDLDRGVDQDSLD